MGRATLPQTAGWRLGTDTENQFSAKLYDVDHGATFIGSAKQQPLDTWTHLAVTFAKSGAVTLYVNGVLAASTPYSATLADEASTVRIGCRGDGSGNFHGSIDEVRIYNSALDAAAVAKIAALTP